jgi:tRNA(fMet)-specific endonuclease VapC
MGLILDSDVLIAGERRGETVKQLIWRIRNACGDTESALSVISIVELTHGVYRAENNTVRLRRSTFVEELSRDLIVHPVSLEIAQLAGRIEGQQAAKGISIGFEDLIIGATALYLGFDVATLNLRHFEAIPSLKLVQI